MENLDNEFLTLRNVTGLLQCSDRTVFLYIQKGVFPKAISMSGRKNLWPKATVLKWLELQHKQFEKTNKNLLKALKELN